jgi:methylated-DNA-[protein]-cysteine S-methyltransferase
MHKTISTSIGELTVVADESGAITGVEFGGRAATGTGAPATGTSAAAARTSAAAAGIGAAAADPAAGAADRAAAALHAAATQLREYLAGERTDFDLALEPHGNSFELLVWDELLRIPYGETTSYGEIARRIGHAGAARAVGRANARNPIAIVVPCHRVIGTNGSLTGYGGGLERKRALLALEAETARW